MTPTEYPPPRDGHLGDPESPVGREHASIQPEQVGAAQSPQTDQQPAPRYASRRAVLAAGLGVVGLAGFGLYRHLSPFGSEPDGYSDQDQGSGADCVDPSTLTSTGTLGGAALVYEVNRRPTAMRFNPDFLTQLKSWLKDFNDTSRYRGVTGIDSYGAHVAKDGCRSWHAAGRAFDIARLRSGSTTLVSCRTDLFGEQSPAQQQSLTRRYWTLAASLHLHFAYVLTHHFDDLHRNHIHVDNGVSGAGMSRFDPDSRVQNQAVEAICTTIWGRTGTVTGSWDSAREQVAPVLAELGVKDLTRQQTWQSFLRASVKRG